MKTKLIAIAMVTLALTANAQTHFESWMARVYRAAPRHELKLHPNDERRREAEEHFFYLYCWQSGDHSIQHAIREAKKAWGRKR